MTRGLISTLHGHVQKSPIHDDSETAAIIAAREEWLAYGRRLWLHILTECDAGPHCPYEHCDTLRSIVTHFVTCEAKMQCATCGPVLRQVWGRPSFTPQKSLDSSLAELSQALGGLRL